jgi:7-cyano-7-deazaguanine synthase
MPITNRSKTSGGDATTVGLLFSGGLDSAILLGELLRRGHFVAPFYVRTDCIWQEAEFKAASRFLTAIARPALASLTLFDMPLGDLYPDHWSITGRGVPAQGSAEEAVFLPGRNQLLLLKPALWCQMHGFQQLAIATLAGNPFNDATPGFFAAFEEMMRWAAGASLHINRPFAANTKRDVMQLGRRLPLELTFSCLSPVGGYHCGRCNKCAERQAAFQQGELSDPTRYAEHAVSR